MAIMCIFVVGVAPSLGVDAIVRRLKQFTTYDLWLRAGGVCVVFIGMGIMFCGRMGIIARHLVM